MEVRAFRVAEKAKWLGLWQGYQEFYGVSLPAPVTEETWLRIVEPAEPVRAFGAFDGNELAGIVHFIFHRSTWMTGDTCYLQDLFVAPAHRGRSVGRTLIEAVYVEADKCGGGQVYWLTHRSNHTACKLYDRVAKNSGFLLYERHAEVAE